MHNFVLRDLTWNNRWLVDPPVELEIQHCYRIWGNIRYNIRSVGCQC